MIVDLDSDEFKKFLDEVKKVLAGEIEKTSIKDLAASRDEIINHFTRELGEEKRKELFFLAATTDKKEWPEQKVDFLTYLTVTRQENKFKI